MTAAILTMAAKHRAPRRSAENPQKQADSMAVRGVSGTTPIAPRNDASHAVKHGSASQLRKTESGQSVLVPLYFIAALLTFASGICQAQPAPASGFLDGDIREAVQEIREARKAQQEFTAESREWRGIWERTETRIVNWDGSKLTAIWQAFTTGLVGLYRIVIEAFSLAKYLAVAVIALCAVRGLREVSDAVVAWRPKG